MRRVIVPSFLAAVVVCTSCAQPTKAPAPPTTSAAAQALQSKAAAPQPAPGPTASLELRPTAQWQRLLDLQQEYLGKEGATRRGRAFSDLAMALNMTLLWPSIGRHEAISELQVLALLGPPDFGYSVSSGADMIYSYWRPEAHEDWAVEITISSRGLITHMYWNSLTAYARGGELNPLRSTPCKPEMVKVDPNS
jgi:hypothetical protein